MILQYPCKDAQRSCSVARIGNVEIIRKVSLELLKICNQLTTVGTASPAQGCLKSIAGRRYLPLRPETKCMLRCHELNML
jgi:hypothetical protein